MPKPFLNTINISKLSFIKVLREFDGLTKLDESSDRTCWLDASPDVLMKPGYELTEQPLGLKHLIRHDKHLVYKTYLDIKTLGLQHNVEHDKHWVCST